MLVPAIRTIIQAKDFLDAIRGVYPKEYLSDEAVRVLIAHSAFETGWWAHTYNYNLGNIKWYGQKGDHCQRECQERLTWQYFNKNKLTEGFGPYTTNDTDNHTGPSVIFLPGSRHANFMAYPDLVAAVISHVEFVLLRTTLEVPGNHGKDLVYEFCTELKDAGYFTADLDRYAAGVFGCYNMLESLFSMPSFPIQPGELACERLARIAKEFAAAGNKSWAWLEKGTDRSMSSCAITVRAIWWHAGCAGFGTYKAGMPISASIIDPAKQRNAYVAFTNNLTKAPGMGDVLYIDNGSRTNAHIVMLVSDVDVKGVVETVEGGQGGVHVGRFKRQLHKVGNKCYLTTSNSVPTGNSREVVGVCYGSRMGVPEVPLKQTMPAAPVTSQWATPPPSAAPTEPRLQIETTSIIELDAAEAPVIEQVPKPSSNGVIWLGFAIGLVTVAFSFLRSC